MLNKDTDDGFSINIVLEQGSQTFLARGTLFRHWTYWDTTVETFLRASALED